MMNMMVKTTTKKPMAEKLGLSRECPKGVPA
jgi:hypothetical protein